MEQNEIRYEKWEIAHALTNLNIHCNFSFLHFQKKSPFEVQHLRASYILPIIRKVVAHGSCLILPIPPTVVVVFERIMELTRVGQTLMMRWINKMKCVYKMLPGRIL